MYRPLLSLTPACVLHNIRVARICVTVHHVPGDTGELLHNLGKVVDVPATKIAIVVAQF